MIKNSHRLATWTRLQWTPGIPQCPGMLSKWPKTPKRRKAGRVFDTTSSFSGSVHTDYWPLSTDHWQLTLLSAGHLLQSGLRTTMGSRTKTFLTVAYLELISNHKFCFGCRWKLWIILLRICKCFIITRDMMIILSLNIAMKQCK